VAVGQHCGAFPVTGPRIFVIDDHADFRRLLAHHLSVRWPEVDVQDYDPAAFGSLPEGFSGAGSDVVLLGHPAGGGDALEWLRRLRANPRFPPVIFFGDGDERQIVAAIRSGAADYIGKSTMTHQRLVESVATALGAGGSAHQPARQEPGNSAAPELPGYEIVRLISQNDIASVYLGRERSGERMVVLKVLRHLPDSGNEKHFDRFLQEYELVARVAHPNVVRIFGLGVADDHAFIAMEYCGGGTLKRRIGEGMTADSAYQCMRVIAGALGALHVAGICHRDLKPTNIMFREDGSPVLIDFGLAKHAHFKAAITGAGAIFGTPYYMSPEQGHGGAVDQRSDIYSLGVVFFEMLMGRKPYDGPAAMSVIIQHREAPLPRLAPAVARFQPALDRMLAKNPEQRFQTMDEVLAWSPSTGPLADTALAEGE